MSCVASPRPPTSSRRCPQLLQAPGPHDPVVARLAGRLALAHLLHVRVRGHIADSVGHFHLSNGARLERINPDGDLSRQGPRVASG